LIECGLGLELQAALGLFRLVRSAIILTAGFGEGHNAAARGLTEGFAALGDMHPEALDLFTPAFGSFYQKMRRDYIDVVNKSPGTWAAVYSGAEHLPFVSLILKNLWPLKRELVTALRKWQPAAVIAVYPAYGYVLEAAAQEAGLLDLKRYILITDSITVHPVWHRCDADTFMVPNEDTANVLYQRGIERSRVLVSGFPVSPRYAVEGPVREDPLERPRVLYMINGQPGRAISLVERLLREDKVELTATTGRDEALKSELEALAKRLQKPLKVLGWIDNMPDLLRSNHLLIGKAGGATVQETLAAGTPMLITQILPGQEEGNARLLLQNGCGASCPTNEAVLETLSSCSQTRLKAGTR
jgi:processive 1,2-diacylglycerol beta-glucosyltransferase